MFFIPYTSIPRDKQPSYLCVVSAFRPEKANARRIRWTVGGDRIYYAADVSTKAADLTTAKILLNSVISTPGARFLGIDIKDFYMHIPLQMLPTAIIKQYNLTPLIHNNCVYVEIRKGMYGLPQASKLANNQLIAALALVVSPGPRMLIFESNQSQETFHLIESIPNHKHQNTKHPNSNLV
jgi:hypothetical protein